VRRTTSTDELAGM